jgi:hypothetical protein
MPITALKVSPSAQTLLNELKKIFSENYCKNEQLKKEISKILYRETGNDNLWVLCQQIADF